MSVFGLNFACFDPSDKILKLNITIKRVNFGFVANPSCKTLNCDHMHNNYSDTYIQHRFMPI